MKITIIESEEIMKGGERWEKSWSWMFVMICKKVGAVPKIMNAVQPLEVGDTFILHAPFKPVPLFAVMKAKGFTYEAEQLDKKHWKVTFVKQG